MNTSYLPQHYASTLYDLIQCQGGWDTKTPSLALPNGYVRQVQNFEVSAVRGGGYVRADGYERFDGQTAPSSASFSILQVAMSYQNTGQVTPQLVVGNPSGASGILLWFGPNYLVVTNVTGAFAAGDNLFDIAANPLGNSVTSQTFVPTNKETALYTAAAADYYRSLIQKVPGSGSILGVAVLPISGADQVFAWRNNVGGTACNIYKATTSGWTQVTLFNEVSFTAGTTAPAEGDTLTQGAVTAVIKRVVLETGSWLGGTAAGRLIIANPAGGNFGAGAATAPGSTMTLSGIQTAITISPGGRYVFSIYNFFGQSSTRRLYGASGIQRAFEFDGTVYVPINHNDANRFPLLVACHKKHLMLAVESSILHSGPGAPYQINAAAGGGEIAVGDKISNFLPQPGDDQGGSLALTTASNAHVLYGSSALDWNLIDLNMGIMGIPYTGGVINQGYWLDDNGLVNLATTRNFGNFTSASLTNTISDFIQEKVGLTVGSAIQHNKSQYRLYFSDSTGLYATLVNGRLMGLMAQKLSHAFFCLWDGVTTNTRLFAGGTDGYVYQLDSGTSFDGEDIDAHLIFNWNHTKSPRTLKRYRKASIEMQGGLYAAIQFGFNMSYGRSGIPQEAPREYSVLTSGSSFWDSFTWDNFYWDGSVVAPTEVEMRGSAENIQLVIRSGTNYTPSYSINSILMHYSNRRGLR